MNTGRCGNYPKRKQLVRDCVVFGLPQRLRKLDWLPQTCAYRLVGEGKDLPAWHPLQTSDPASVIDAGISVAGRCGRGARGRRFTSSRRRMAWLLKQLGRKTVVPANVTKHSLIAALGDPAMAERIEVRVSVKARRVSLRVDAAAGHVVLVHPRRMGVSAVLAFAASKRDWIATHLAALPPRVQFADGTAIPLRGTPHVLRFAPEKRGGVWRENGEIIVTGRREHAPRRLTDWLRTEARAAISPLARAISDRLGRTVGRVSVRDTTSRWGSCSRSGALSFSWRLILAPDFVFTYVVAHEVAHLKHMDHSAAFWRTVDRLMPDGAEAAKSARDWLRRHGTVLHCYG